VRLHVSYDPVVVSSRVEVYSLVAISYSGALPAACWYRGGLVRALAPVLKAPGLSDFWRLPPKTPTPLTTSGLLFLRDSCPALVTNLVAVLRPVAFHFRQPAQLRFPALLPLSERQASALQATSTPLASRATTSSWRLCLLLMRLGISVSS
jgi:hypothetical protein